MVNVTIYGIHGSYGIYIIIYNYIMLDILTIYICIDTVCVYIRLNFRRNHSEPLDLIDDAMKAINDSHDMTRRRRYQQLWWLPTDMVMQVMNWENVWTKKI